MAKLRPDSSCRDPPAIASDCRQFSQKLHAPLTDAAEHPILRSIREIKRHGIDSLLLTCCKLRILSYSQVFFPHLQCESADHLEAVRIYFQKQGTQPTAMSESFIRLVGVLVTYIPRTSTARTIWLTVIRRDSLLYSSKSLKPLSIALAEAAQIQRLNLNLSPQGVPGQYSSIRSFSQSGADKNVGL